MARELARRPKVAIGEVEHAAEQNAPEPIERDETGRDPVAPWPVPVDPLRRRRSAVP